MMLFIHKTKQNKIHNMSKKSFFPVYWFFSGGAWVGLGERSWDGGGGKAGKNPYIPLYIPPPPSHLLFLPPPLTNFKRASIDSGCIARGAQWRKVAKSGCLRIIKLIINLLNFLYVDININIY